MRDTHRRRGKKASEAWTCERLRETGAHGHVSINGEFGNGQETEKKNRDDEGHPLPDCSGEKKASKVWTCEELRGTEALVKVRTAQLRPRKESGQGAHLLSQGVPEGQM